MKKAKRLLCLALALVLMLAFAACGQTSGIYTAGTYTATAAGHGGAVTVTVKTTANEIQNVDLDLVAETAAIGQAAGESLKGQILEAQSAEIDGVTGATDTSRAVKTALAQCLAEAMGEDRAVSMAAGSYEASAFGFYPGMPVTVSVIVSDTAIEYIAITGENMETQLMLRAVEDKLIPRMIEAQSAGVDAITGATQTSSAVKNAVSACLTEALVAGGSPASALASFMQAPEYETGEAITLDTDILVVGLGGAGIAAALSAADNGADVLAIEKAGKYGGTICVTGEMFAVNPERFTAENNGGADYIDGEALLTDWLTLTHGDAKSEMVELLLDESGDTLDWLMYDHEWLFGSPMLGHAPYAVFECCFGYMPNNTYGNKNQIAGYLDGLMADYTAAGGEYMLETEGVELIYDAATNTVTGVHAVGYDGQEYIINARATVLATGGYGSNEELMDEFMTNEYFPLAGDWHTYGMTTNDGKLIASALEIGAGTYNPSVPPISHLAGFPINLTGFENYTKDGEISFFTGKTPIWSEGDIPTTLSVAADSLAVNMDGERFINEELFANHGAIIAGPNYYTVWSQTQLDTFKTEGLIYEDMGPSMGYLGRQSTIPAGTPLGEMDAVIQAGIDAGYIYKADTIEELASLMGVPADTLSATVSDYNAACEAGADAQFEKQPQYLTAVDGGTYYAISGCAFMYSTGGALDINSDFQVLMADGATPIEGLYAIGNDSVGVLLSEQEQYVDYGGAAASWAFTGGRLVGEALAEKFAQ